MIQASKLLELDYALRSDGFRVVGTKERNRVERFFNKIKHLRRVATRVEKLASNFLGMIKLAAIQTWLRYNEPTT